MLTNYADSEKLQEILSEGNLPKHVAIIMDGNGRWAQERFKPRVWGHHMGVKSVRNAVETACKMQLETLTLYAFSEENWGRPEHEVKTILSLLDTYIVRERENLKKNNIRFQAIGALEKLSTKTQALLAETREYLSNCTGLVLNIALSYGARSELTLAVKSLAKKVLAGTLSIDSINQDSISQALWTKGLRDPDLLIRTSGEQRISNFLLWQMAYTEFWFTPIHWPDFRMKHFCEAVAAYQKRQRRYGLASSSLPLSSADEAELAKELGALNA